MSPREASIALRETLAELYPETNDARGVAKDAGLNRGRIDFNGKIINVWRSVLEEAEKSNKLGQVVQVALTAYPENPILQQAAQMFGASASASGLGTASAQSMGDVYNITIQNSQGIAIGHGAQAAQTQTDGGSYVAGNVEAGQDFVGRDQTPGATPPKPA